jgi:hypothetical protein
LTETEIQPKPQATPTLAGTLPPPPQATLDVAAEEQVEDTDMAATPLAEEPPAPPARRISALRIIEIVLLLAAIGSGITAFIFRRRSL